MKRILCSTSNETIPISSSEQQKILKLFRKYEIDVLDTWEDYVEEDGVRFNQFNVSTNNTNEFILGQLLKDLHKFEDTYDIGCSNERNDYGFYAKDYHFYHYLD